MDRSRSLRADAARSAVGALAAFCLGCGGGGAAGGTHVTKTDGGQSASVIGAGTLTATIDGAAWASASNTTIVSASSASPGELTISGTQGSATNYTSLSFALGFIAGQGSYPLGVDEGTTAGGSVTIIKVASASSVTNWMTDLTGARGAITFATLADGHMTGQFAFTAPPLLAGTGGSDSMVTDGMFDLAYPDTFTPPTGDDMGSTMSATLNGQPWNAAAVAGIGDAPSGVLSITGMTTGVSLSFTTSMPVAPSGTYDQTAISVQATGTGANCCWGGAGVTLSVTITSLGATRAAGMFSATLPLSAGGAATAPLTITGGTFDVKVQPAG